MAQRIKVTGYLPVEEVDPAFIDLSHESGLTEGGWDQLLSAHGDPANSLKVSDLEDVEPELMD